jgi:hypothetical protein
MKKQSNAIETESVKLSIKPSIHEDSACNPQKIIKSHVKSINK